MRTRERKEKVKELQHNFYLEKKLTRDKELLVQQSHKLALSALMENCALEIEDAFAVAADATNDKLEAEKKRLEASSEFSQKIQEERRLAREKAERERGRHDDVVKQINDQWIQKLAGNLTKAKKERDAAEKKCRRRMTHVWLRERRIWRG